LGGLGAALQAQSPPLDSLELFATPLPAHFGVLERVEGLELRLYVDGRDAAPVRVTPTCVGVAFKPSSVLFNASFSLAGGIAATASASGELTIQYVASLEDGSAETVVLLSQTVTVLPAPTAYAVDAEAWGGVVLQSDSVDDTTAAALTSSFWSEQKHGYASSACGAFDGANSLFFTSLGDRLALTAPLALSGFHGKMHFHHLYGFEDVQAYDAHGDNRVACEVTDAGEEVLFGYLPQRADPLNVSTWKDILEIPLPSRESARPREFAAYSVVLPAVAMHQSAQFYWLQKNHSSFPIDVATGLSREEVVAAENDPTGVQGQRGTRERELWTYRNLFDQWAIDDVRLEVRLDVPTFSSTSEGAGAGEVDVLVSSPVPGSWVALTSGDGTQAFPDCSAAAPDSSKEATVTLSTSGYVHAVACLTVNGLLISSYPARSPRFLVQAIEPSVSSSVDTTGSVDTWSVDLQCTGCEFMRYVVAPLAEGSSGTAFVPSCTFGTSVRSASGRVSVAFNAKLRVVACGADLLASTIVESQDLVVQPRKPTFQVVIPRTTITGFMALTIAPPSSAADQELGIAYVVVESEQDVPTCSSALSSGEVALEVKVFDVVRAVACCADSAVATWGPVDVRAVTPTHSTACSAIKPLTLVVELATATVGASVRYQLRPADSTLASLTCSTGTPYERPVEVGVGTATLVAVSCLDGLVVSDPAEIPIALDKCCAGRSAYLHESCAHVLLLHDDFAKCPGDGGAANVQTNTHWHSVTSQWGGSGVNGGVHSDNVRCVADAALGKQVLALTANGDLYADVAPVGTAMTSEGDVRDRTVDDRFMEWSLEGISPLPCSPLEHCPARRVGAAVTSALEPNAGVMVMRVKPCAAFGTLTQVWWGSYEHADVPTSADDVGIPFLPLWKSALYQAKTTPAVPFTLTAPQPADDAAYTEIVIQWDASAARSNLYVDGQLVLKQTGTAGQAGASSPLSIGVWFPDAAAGEPFFPTCQTYVDQVQVFGLEITGGRWCDFEDVAAGSVPCTADAECVAWVRVNCFMDMFEAVCTHSRASDVDDADSAAPSHSSAQFCQFRLPPTAQTRVSSTAMASRAFELQWQEEEEPKQEAA